VIVNASIPALVALRGLDFDTSPRARLDRRRIRQAYETPVARVTRVSRPWRRNGRRFIQVRLEVPDITRLSNTAPFGWSSYTLARGADSVDFRQEVGAPANRPIGDVGWRGDELVAFRLHLPSRILFHNARDIWRGNAPGDVERGNIVSWEQRLGDRLKGEPVVVELRLEPRSILYRTLTLFGLAVGAAVCAMGGVVWWVARKGGDQESANL
jgi:hypothetical protein